MGVQYILSLLLGDAYLQSQRLRFLSIICRQENYFEQIPDRPVTLLSSLLRDVVDSLGKR